MADGFFRCKEGFTVVQNIVSRDRNVSMKAKGLYLVIQSYITMQEKKWKKSDFEKMVGEGEKAFNSAWNELKETGYLKTHIFPNNGRFVNEYELLDQPVEGPHTFYYNKDGVVSTTNETRKKAEHNPSGDDKGKRNPASDPVKQETNFIPNHKEKEESGDLIENQQQKEPLKEENDRYPQNGIYGKGIYGKGSNANGNNANGGNKNKSLSLKTVSKNYQSIHSIEQEKDCWKEYTPEKCRELNECLRKNVEYDIRKQKENVSEFALFDSLISVITDFINKPPKGYLVHIAKEDRPFDETVDRFMQLRYEHINCARKKIKNRDLSAVTDFSAYALSIIYAVSKFPADALKERRKESGFNDFEQHEDYDFAELERLTYERQCRLRKQETDGKSDKITAK